MIIQFSVKNYLSFKEKQTFTSLSNSDKLHENNLIFTNNKKYSKINVIYGANASGKTSLFRALMFLREYVLNSNNLLEGTITPVIPFKFDSNTIKQPTELEIVFVKNNIKYAYGFVCDANKIHEEYLYSYENGRETIIFERKNTTEYKFNSDQAILNDIKMKNTNNKLFLTTAATWNYEKAKPVVEYLLNDIYVSFDYKTNIEELLEKLKNNGEFDSYKKFALNILSQGDFNISDFEFESKKVEDEKQLNAFRHGVMNLPFEVKNLDKMNVKEIKFNTIHNIVEDNQSTKYSLSFVEESLGTQNLLSFAPLLYDVFKNGKVLVIDEIDKSMHPIIVAYIVNMFVNENINKNNAQIIFNTHDTNLLDLDLFRRDEIWFTEKNNQTGATDLYPLTDCSPRKKENIQKGYLVGRYGAIPFITNNSNIWEE